MLNIYVHIIKYCICYVTPPNGIIGCVVFSRLCTVQGIASTMYI